MPVKIESKGGRVDAVFSGKVLAEEVLALWGCLTGAVACGFIDFSEATNFPRSSTLYPLALSVAPLRPIQLAFVCPDRESFGSVRMIISTFGLEPGFDIFQTKEQALLWLQDAALNPSNPMSETTTDFAELVKTFHARKAIPVFNKQSHNRWLKAYFVADNVNLKQRVAAYCGENGLRLVASDFQFRYRIVPKEEPKDLDAYTDEEVLEPFSIPIPR